MKGILQQTIRCKLDNICLVLEIWWLTNLFAHDTENVLSPKRTILKIENKLFYQKTPSLTAKKEAHQSFIFCSSIWASFNIIVITNLLIQDDGKVSEILNVAGISCQCNARLTTRRKFLVLVPTVKVRWKRRYHQWASSIYYREMATKNVIQW